MMLRIAAAASVALGVTILMLYLGLVGKAPWSTPQERHLRAIKDRTAAPDSLEPVSFQDMATLPRNVPVAQYAAFERRAVSLEGYVQRMLRAPDGDFHLDFADTLPVRRGHPAVAPGLGAVEIRATGGAVPPPHRR